MNKTIDIDGKLIGKNQPMYFIAEAGVNHNNSIEIAYKLVDAAKDSGADAIKFQTFKAENIALKNAPKAEYHIQTTGNGSGEVPGTPILRDIQLVRGEVSIPHLLEDLFWLSKIHGGSTRQPGLPIPQAYAHKLAERAGRGVHIPNTFNTDMSFL